MTVVEKDSSRREKLSHNTAVETLSKIPPCLDSYQLIFLAVKPLNLQDVANDLKTKLNKNQHLVMSILAGVSLCDLERTLCYDGNIVRVMSNLPISVGEAASALSSNITHSPTVHAFILQLFDCCGETYWVKEEMMDAITALAGSGPAYMFMIIEALSAGGLKMGLPRDLAQKLAIQTMLGSAKLLKHSGKHPAILRDEVSTPAGTTIDAIHELERLGLRSALIDALEIATKKSKKTGKSLNKRKNLI